MKKLTSRKAIKDKVVELRDSYPNESNVILETAIKEGIALEQKELAEQERLIERAKDVRAELYDLERNFDAGITESEKDEIRATMKDYINELDRLSHEIHMSYIVGCDLIVDAIDDDIDYYKGVAIFNE